MADHFEVTLPDSCHWTRELVQFTFNRILEYCPITAKTLNRDSIDLSIFDDTTLPPPPHAVVAKTNNLVDQYGAEHGPAIVLWLPESPGETYHIKEYLKV